MTPEERDLLTQSIKLSEENNKMLRAMRRGARFVLLWRITYWTLIIGLSYGSYVYLQPYITQLQNTSTQIQKDVANLQSGVSKLPSSVTNILKK